MPEAARSVLAGSTEQPMFKVVHDSVANGVTIVIRTANVLRCG